MHIVFKKNLLGCARALALVRPVASAGYLAAADRNPERLRRLEQNECTMQRSFSGRVIRGRLIPEHFPLRWRANQALLRTFKEAKQARLPRLSRETLTPYRTETATKQFLLGQALHRKHRQCRSQHLRLSEWGGLHQLFFLKWRAPRLHLVQKCFLARSSRPHLLLIASVAVPNVVAPLSIKKQLCLHFGHHQLQR
jgi:hypothetical protein